MRGDNKIIRRKRSEFKAKVSNKHILVSIANQIPLEKPFPFTCRMFSYNVKNAQEGSENIKHSMSQTWQKW